MVSNSARSLYRSIRFLRKYLVAGSCLAGTVATTYGYISKSESVKTNFIPAIYAEEHFDTLGKQNTNAAPLYRIVLTGGPCAGKSSALTRLSERLQALGFQVFTVAEVATLLLTGGATFKPDMTLDEIITWESGLLKTQMSLEDAFTAIAKASGKPTVILCDRGVMDGSAYLDKPTWEALLDQNGWSEPKLRDARYDCVVHLVTAAIGAENYYTLANNLARTESKEVAAELDVKLREAYLGHSNVYMIDNSTGFEEKIARVLDVVSHKVGFPRPANYRRRFLLKGEQLIDTILSSKYATQEIAIEQTFLKVDEDDPNVRRKIVKRGQSGVNNFTLTTTIKSEDGKEETEVSRPISAKTFVSLMAQRDPNRVPVCKTIRTFVHKENYLEVHTYTSPKHGKGVSVLQVEVDPKVKFDVRGGSLPKFLEDFVDHEVTDDEKYQSCGFSKKLSGE
ncbi:rasef [Acrasis kona]|uniref:Rasef n=1 Tax=Acrasis kona TaxID=1008807 RepID=A0AAW2ZF96_9EUKA